MDEWVTAPLAEVLDFREGPGIMAADFRDSGVPLVRLAGLKRGADILEGCNFLDPDMVARKWDHFRLREGDVVLSTSASLGEVAIVGAAGVGAVPYTGIIAFRPAGPDVDARLIPHLLTAPSFKAQIEAMGVGSVMKHFGPSHLRKMSVTYPKSRRLQLGIAQVLGAIDDKVAANRRALDGCVALADAHFEQVAAFAQLSTTTYGDAALVQGGGTPKTGEIDFWGGPVRWATPTDVTSLEAPYLTSTTRTLTSAGLSACTSQLHPAGSVLMTSRATIGAFAIAQEPMAVNQGFIVVNAVDPDLQWWLYHDMRSRVDEFVSRANGATFLELSRGNFKKMEVAVPDCEVRRQFRDLVLPLHNLAAQLMRENDALVATRDELLPLLMSGRIAVRELPDDLAEAVS